MNGAGRFRGKSIRDTVCAYGWGVAAPVLCTLLDWPLRGVLAPASILMIYLLGVLAVAILHGRWPSAIAALLSAPAFAFFFAPPIFSLAMKDLENSVALGVMLLVSHVTSTSLERMRSQAAIAERRERRASALYRLSEALSGARTVDEVAQVAAHHIQAARPIHAALLLPDAQGRLACSGEAPQFIDRGQAQAVFDHGADAPLAAQAAKRIFPLMGAAGPLGVLALEAERWQGLSDPEERSFLDMILNQIAQSLERIRLAEQARLASIQAETETLRNSLLSAISHDLRTPLTRIVGTASALADQDEALTGQERREFTLAIQDEAQRMADLMSKILDMARLASGKIALHLEWHALEEIVGATLTRLDSLLNGRPVAIRLPDGLPLVKIDAVLFQQVLINLIENAVKYTPAGSPIEVSVAWAPHALRFAVADRGPGIPEELKGRVFEKFYRVVPESPQSGAGLGLALCRAIVEAHGGEIGAADRPGGGAVFFLTLPLEGQPPGLDWHEESPEAPP